MCRGDVVDICGNLKYWRSKLEKLKGEVDKALVIVVEGLHFAGLEGPKAHPVLKCLRHSPVWRRNLWLKRTKTSL